MSTDENNIHHNHSNDYPNTSKSTPVFTAQNAKDLSVMLARFAEPKVLRYPKMALGLNSIGMPAMTPYENIGNLDVIIKPRNWSWNLPDINTWNSWLEKDRLKHLAVQIFKWIQKVDDNALNTDSAPEELCYDTATLYHLEKDIVKPYLIRRPNERPLHFMGFHLAALDDYTQWIESDTLTLEFALFQLVDERTLGIIQRQRFRGNKQVYLFPEFYAVNAILDSPDQWPDFFLESSQHLILESHIKQRIKLQSEMLFHGIIDSIDAQPLARRIIRKENIKDLLNHHSSPKADKNTADVPQNTKEKMMLRF